MKPMKGNHGITSMFEIDYAMMNETHAAQDHSENLPEGRAIRAVQNVLSDSNNLLNQENGHRHQNNHSEITRYIEMNHRELQNQYSFSARPSGWGNISNNNVTPFPTSFTTRLSDNIAINQDSSKKYPNMQGCKLETLSIPVNGLARLHQRRKNNEIQKNDIPESSSSGGSSALSDESVTNGLEILSSEQSIEHERSSTKYIAQCLQNQITKLQDQITIVQSEIPESQMNPEKADQLRNIYQELEQEIEFLKMKKEEVSDTYLKLTQRLESLLLQKTKLKEIADEIKVTLTHPMMQVEENIQKEKIGEFPIQESNKMEKTTLKKLKHDLQENLEKLHLLRQKLRIEAKEKLKPRTIDLDLSAKSSEPCSYQSHSNDPRPNTRHPSRHRINENVSGSSNEQLLQTTPMKFAIFLNDKKVLQPISEDLEANCSDEFPDSETMEEIQEEESQITFDGEDYSEEDLYMADVSDTDCFADKISKPDLKPANSNSRKCKSLNDNQTNSGSSEAIVTKNANSNDNIIQFDIKMAENTKPASLQIKLPTSSRTKLCIQDSKKDLNKISSETQAYHQNNKERSILGETGVGKTYRVRNSRHKFETKSQMKQATNDTSKRDNASEVNVDRYNPEGLIIKLEVNNNDSGSDGVVDRVLHKLTALGVNNKRIKKNFSSDQNHQILETLYMNPTVQSSVASLQNQLGKSENDLMKSKQLIFGKFPIIPKSKTQSFQNDKVEKKNVWIPNNTSNFKKIHNSGLSPVNRMVVRRSHPSGELNNQKFVTFKEDHVRENNKQSKSGATSTLLNSSKLTNSLSKTLLKPRVPSHIVPPLNKEGSTFLPPVHLLSSTNIVKKPSISNFEWVLKLKDDNGKSKEKMNEGYFSEYNMGVKKKKKLPDHLVFGKFKHIYHQKDINQQQQVRKLPEHGIGTSISRETMKRLLNSSNGRNYLRAKATENIYLNGILKKNSISFSNHKMKVDIPNIRKLTQHLQ